MIQLESINLVLDKKCIFLKWFKLLSLFFDLKGEKKIKFYNWCVKIVNRCNLYNVIFAQIKLKLRLSISKTLEIDVQKFITKSLFNELSLMITTNKKLLLFNKKLFLIEVLVKTFFSNMPANLSKSKRDVKKAIISRTTVFLTNNFIEVQIF